MPHLSPKIEAWLIKYNHTMSELLAKGFRPTPTNAREGLAELTRSLVTARPEISWVADDRVHGPRHTVPVRIYHPAPDAKLSVLMYCHGGGHMAGSVKVYDLICRKLARAANHIVVSVDYRLAPEHPYPAGVDDALTAAANMWEMLERLGLNYQRRLSIAGDSGGGALCATVAHKAQYEPSLDIHNQALIYPSLDYTMTLPSITSNGTGYLLEASKIKWYFDHYFQNSEDRRKASPLHMEITARLPRTLVVTAEYCPLRDEGLAYVAKLCSAGIHAQGIHFNDMVHAFLNMENLAPQACDTVYASIGAFLNT